MRERIMSERVCCAGCGCVRMVLTVEAEEGFRESPFSASG